MFQIGSNSIAFGSREKPFVWLHNCCYEQCSKKHRSELRQNHTNTQCCILSNTHKIHPKKNQSSTILVFLKLITRILSSDFCHVYLVCSNRGGDSLEIKIKLKGKKISYYFLCKHFSLNHQLHFYYPSVFSVWLEFLHLQVVSSMIIKCNYYYYFIGQISEN